MVRVSVENSDTLTEQVAQADDTLIRLLVSNYHKYGNKGIAMRRKQLGLWKQYTWKDCYDNVKFFSLGLLRLGFERGDKLAIIGDNSPEGFWAELGAMAAGGIAAGAVGASSSAGVATR